MSDRKTNRRRALQQAVELMEPRRMMSVSLDSASWTQITPSSNTRQIFVSSSTGSDSNSGLSAATPVKTIAKGVSLLRSGSPDWLELKRGDVFTDAFPDWTKSGQDAQDPMVITTYGNPSAARPWLKTGSSRGFFSDTAFHDVAMIGLKFSANTRDPSSPDYTGTAGGYGFQLVGPDSNVLLEDDSFDHYVYNASIQGFSGYATNITIRRSEFLDSYDINGAKSEGLYASNVDGLTLEGNIFDHNGWNQQVSNAIANIYSHDIYLWETTKNVVVKDNIIADASSHGIQARGGGEIEDNLFLKNPIDALLGGGSTVTPGGVSGDVDGNVFTEDRDTNGATRGWAIEASNIKAGGGSTISDNIITGDTQNQFAAIELQTDTTADNASTGSGLHDLTISGNIVDQWHQGIYIASGFVLGGTGDTGLSGLKVSDNDFQNTLSQKIINQYEAFNGGDESWSGNTYYNGQSTSGWFAMGNSTMSLAAWQSKVEPTAVDQQVQYADPGRTVASYNGSIGGASTEAAFLAAVRSMNKANWNTAYTADAVVKYFQAGYATGSPASTGGSSTGGTTTGGSTGGSTGTLSNSSAPAAALTSAPGVTTAGGASETIKVTYTDANGIATSSVGSGDIKVTGPNGFSQAATLVSVDSSTNGTPRTATYSIAAPGGGWDSSDNGTYTVTLNSNGVKDTTGIYAVGKTLGTFSVNIGSTVVSTDAAATVLWSTFNPSTQVATVKFSEDVGASLNLSDLRMKNEQTLALIPYDQMTMTYDKATFTATWTFTQPLPVANYKIILSSDGVKDANNNHLDGNGDGAGASDYFIYVSSAELADAAAL